MAAAEDRATSVLFRCSHEEKAQLIQDAEDLGITLQALLERRIVNKFVTNRRRTGPQPRLKHPELPLTG